MIKPGNDCVARVKDALEHLYDLRYLEQHPLAAAPQDQATPALDLAGQRLRRELAAAIESLSPGPRASFRAPQARAYNLLTMHYVEGMTVQEAAFKLGISRRQAHRDLSEARQSVAAVFAARRSTPAVPESGTAQLSSAHAEVARLKLRLRPTDIHGLIQRSQEMVARLVAQRGVLLTWDVPREPVALPTDPTAAEQVLVSAFSRAIGQALPGELRLALAVAEKQVTLTLCYVPERPQPAAAALDQVTALLADRLGWRVRQEEQPDDRRVVTLAMPRQGAVILVIDDNAGLVTLIERYLTDHAYQVVPAQDGREGLRLAQELLPTAIVLDVMMPEMSGWEVLQRLRNYPKTAQIPVIICSVLNNPALAYSLGASLVLPKPINREDVLSALRQLGVG
ncbi:MAG: hypothetical protein CVU38_03065 [Chloroflexi bacterium HGW-Chloroflexi-1]|nr:MAG: hypothetical protein CVU38_03065 [Chloroflexi bacterium HGW-Chloroflexi-1]